MEEMKANVTMQNEMDVGGQKRKANHAAEDSKIKAAASASDFYCVAEEYSAKEVKVQVKNIARPTIAS